MVVELLPLFVFVFALFGLERIFTTLLLTTLKCTTSAETLIQNFSGFGGEYFKLSEHQKSNEDKSFLQEYKSVLNSKSSEETMVGRMKKKKAPCYSFSFSFFLNFFPSPRNKHLTNLDSVFAGKFSKMGTGSWPVQLPSSLETVFESRNPSSGMWPQNPSS